MPIDTSYFGIDISNMAAVRMWDVEKILMSLNVVQFEFCSLINFWKADNF
jgi:hypothetical protein